MYMKNYLKPYTACTKVESEGYLLAGSPNAGGGGFTPGQPGGGPGQSQKNSTNNAKTTKSYAPYSVGNGISFNIQDEE